MKNIAKRLCGGVLASLLALTLVVGMVPAMNANAAGDSGLSREQVIAKIEEAADNLVFIGGVEAAEFMNKTLTDYLTGYGISLDFIFDEYDNSFEEISSGVYLFTDDPGSDPDTITVTIANGVIAKLDIINGALILEYKNPTPKPDNKSKSSDAPALAPIPAVLVPVDPALVASPKTGEGSYVLAWMMLLMSGLGVLFLSNSKRKA